MFVGRVGQGGAGPEEKAVLIRFRLAADIWEYDDDDISARRVDRMGEKHPSVPSIVNAPPTWTERMEAASAGVWRPTFHARTSRKRSP